jgi:hypothetical protein
LGPAVICAAWGAAAWVISQLKGDAIEC